MECLSASERHTAVVRTSDGALFTCGKNSLDGQLGHGDTRDRGSLTRVEGALLGKRVVAVSAGYVHTAAIADGELFTWGSGGRGKLGHGDEGSTRAPRQVRGELLGKRVVAVSCGVTHTVAITDVGELYFWGSGYTSGQGTDADVLTPRRVGGALLRERVVEVSAGSFHTAVLTAVGTVYTFGGGTFGQLGHGVTSNKRAIPTIVGGALQGHVAVKVSAGGYSTAVVLQSGEVYTFGSRHVSGHATTGTDMLVPTLVAALQGKRVVTISVSSNNAVVITLTGECYTWGNGGYGKLGHGNSNGCNIPKLVNALVGKRVVAVAAALHHTSALTAAGGLFTWGGSKSRVFQPLGRAPSLMSPHNLPSLVPRVGGIPWFTPAAAGARGAGAGASDANTVAAAAAAAAAAALARSGTIEHLPDAYAEYAHLRDANVKELDDDALLDFDRKITRAQACVRSFNDDIAAKRVVVTSELTRRRCAQAVAEATPDFVCPISHALMSDPVVAADGNSYERREIEKWFADGHSSSPMTGAAMPNLFLAPNLNLRKMIARAMEAEMAGGASGSGAGADVDEGGEEANKDRRQRRRVE